MTRSPARPEDFLQGGGRGAPPARGAGSFAISWFRWLLAGVSLSACTVQAEEDVASAERALSAEHVVVVVQRNELSSGQSQGDALAGFIRAPRAADQGAILELAGLLDRPPQVGTCDLGEKKSTPGLFELGEIELVEAEGVHLETLAGVHELAPHAFPTVMDWIRGVVYASRDRSADSLPMGSIYRVRADRIAGFASLDAAAQSPDPLTDLTIGGKPWASLSQLSKDAPLDLSWTPAGANPGDDLLLFTLERDGLALRCAFADSEGVASVFPKDFLAFADSSDGVSAQAGEGNILLQVHRLRTVRSLSSPPRSAESDLANGTDVELRFDFSVSSQVQFE